MVRAPQTNSIVWDEAGWDELLKGIVKSQLEPRAKRIADACNEHVKAHAEATLAAGDNLDAPNILGKRKANASEVSAIRRLEHAGPAEGKDDYMVDTEGSNPLRLNDYRATVITVSERAKADNARSHTLVTNLHLGGGE
jgi:hypothetical protein